ncbi:MAG: glycosyltransferase, partial [Alphaproteobacteria bacterium]|nr:glycosyltransferase [Alphaproteobacteria bacterium]
EVDIALDPFPFNGTTTTLDALLMGVPVVALRGDRHVARLGANVLTRVGLSDLIAETRDGYIEIAARLAADAGRRMILRRELRGMVEVSPIMQARRVVGPLEDFYRRVVK